MMKFSSRFVKFLFIFGVLVSFSGSTVHAENSDLTLKATMVSKHPLKNRPSGGYFILENSGTETRVLVGAKSAKADRIELHETIKENNRMKMVHVPEMVVPANGKLEFKRGGKHLMLFGLSVEEGAKTVAIELVFKNGDTLSADFKIQGPRSRKK